MSFRLFTHRLFRHGRHLFYNYCNKRDIHLNILERRSNRPLTKSSGATKKDGSIKFNETVLRNNTIFRFGQQARRLFVDNVLNRVTPIYSADLRSEATKKFLSGDSAPLFALIGISLASGTGVITKDDELEGVCWEIREAVSRLHGQSDFSKNPESKSELNLENLNIGPPIAKGCSAVVYAAALKDTKTDDAVNTSFEYESDGAGEHHIEIPSPIHNPSRFIHNFGTSLENPHFLREQQTTSPSPAHRQTGRNVRFQSKPEINYRSRNDSLSDGSSLMQSIEDIAFDTENSGGEVDRYPLALKMMFNYDIQSNAMAILRAMYKETIPAMHRYINPDAEGWEKMLMEQSVQLPPHPNIVMMVGVFCAQIPNLMQSSSLYPMALPQRLNPDGYGRNMSLFLLMKRYEYSLCEYLKENKNLSMRTRLLLFAQLLEGVAHLYRHGVAHRDLKSDNLLIDLNGNDVHPILVLSDFGCCIADKNNGLSLPYTSHDVDKGGNTALMAPEIITKVPGAFSVLDYSKSDLWACGAIAYEIFGAENPFYIYSNERNANKAVLKNNSYKDRDLPPLDPAVPFIVRKLIKNILSRNARQRLTPDVAANVMQLFLWAPSVWLKPSTTVNSPEILQWLLSLTTKVLYEARLGSRSEGNANDSLQSIRGKPTHTEYLLLSSFLIRAQLQQIKCALDWIQQTVENY